MHSRWPHLFPRVMTSRLGKGIVVFLFALTTIGLPLEECAAWVTSAATPAASTCGMTPGAGCQCSPARRKAGRCCCQLARASTAKSCCATKSAAKTKSCCASRTAEKSSTPLLTSCGCGSAEELGLLWSAEPRVMSSAVTLIVITSSRDTIVLQDDSLYGVRRSPDTPPPRDQLLSA